MDKLYRRMKVTIIALLFGSFVLVFACVYVPLQISLKHQIEVTFSEECKLYVMSLNFRIKELSNSAKTLASRTMMRQAIIDYLNGSTNIDYLKAYTEPKYADGAKVLESIVFAERTVGNHVIARYRISPDGDDPALGKVEKSPAGSLIQEVSDEWFLHVWVPIRDGDKEIGEDHVVFELNSVLSLLETERIALSLISPLEVNDLYKQSSVMRDDGSYRLLKNQGSLIYVVNVSDTASLLVNGSSNDVFAYYRMVTTAIFLSWAGVFAIVLLVVHQLVLRYVERHVGRTEIACSQYQRMAYIDGLSGAYSRRFLDVLKEDIKRSDEKYVIVMVDIDKFKFINDTYGHDEGDKVIRLIASTLIRSVRSDDFVIRYGGDEFLVIFKNIPLDKAQAVMERALRNAQDSVTGEEHTFSYGLSDVVTGGQIEEAIKDADLKMYAMKRASGSSRAPAIDFEA